MLIVPTRNVPGCECATAGGAGGSSRNVCRTGEGREIAEQPASARTTKNGVRANFQARAVRIDDRRSRKFALTLFFILQAPADAAVRRTARWTDTASRLR